ncbi:hypothetical protein BS78_05G044800 [Paspalum vaginatum]|nr:hypothetical protein BS78_05G044800 [Paspalum vaginatum]
MAARAAIIAAHHRPSSCRPPASTSSPPPSGRVDAGYRGEQTAFEAGPVVDRLASRQSPVATFPFLSPPFDTFLTYAFRSRHLPLLLLEIRMLLLRDQAQMVHGGKANPRPSNIQLPPCSSHRSRCSCFSSSRPGRHDGPLPSPSLITATTIVVDVPLRCRHRHHVVSPGPSHGDTVYPRLRSLTSRQAGRVDNIPLAIA